MAVQILSDLHLEVIQNYDDFQITPRAPYLGLLGDIGKVVGHKDQLLAFLARQLRQFRAVLFVPGNHEAYGSSWVETLAVLTVFEESVRSGALGDDAGEFVLLDRRAFALRGTRTVALGCSLFSSVPPEARDAVGAALNDFHRTTGDWTVQAHNAAHARDVAWLNVRAAELQRDDGVDEVLVLSHWTPTRDRRAVEPRHWDSELTSAFSTDLAGETCFNAPKVRVWAFGHTHYNCDFSFDRGRDTPPLRLVSNQYGYPWAQAQGYDAEKTVGSL